MATTEMVQTPQQLPHHKVKIKKVGQRSCNEKDDKGKFCGGHLKRWYYMTDVVEQGCGDVEQAWGKDAEVYRCEYCKTLNPGSLLNLLLLNAYGRASFEHRFLRARRPS